MDTWKQGDRQAGAPGKRETCEYIRLCDAGGDRVPMGIGPTGRRYLDTCKQRPSVIPEKTGQHGCVLIGIRVARSTGGARRRGSRGFAGPKVRQKMAISGFQMGHSGYLYTLGQVDKWTLGGAWGADILVPMGV